MTKILENSFPGDLRIRKRQDYTKIQSQGLRFSTRYFIVLIQERESGPARLGIVASRKVGCAVERNRVKRMLRELFRCNHTVLPPRTDFCIIARKGAANLKFQNVSKEVLGVVLKMAANKTHVQAFNPQINSNISDFHLTT